MKVTFLTVGSIKKSYVREGFDDYIARIGRYCPVEVVEVKDVSRRGKAPLGSGEAALKKEADRILKKIGKGDFTVVLSEKGAEKGAGTYSSRDFARFIEGLAEAGTKRLCFVVAGPYGFHDSVAERAGKVLSLSPMTLPHELASLVLAEQVYRAFTIIRGEPYSH